MPWDFLPLAQVPSSELCNHTSYYFTLSSGIQLLPLLNYKTLTSYTCSTHSRLPPLSLHRIHCRSGLPHSQGEQRGHPLLPGEVLTSVLLPPPTSTNHIRVGLLTTQGKRVHTIAPSPSPSPLSPSLPPPLPLKERN